MYMDSERECCAQVEELLLEQEGVRAEPDSLIKLSKSSLWNHSLKGWAYFNPRKTRRKTIKLQKNVDFSLLELKTKVPKIGIVLTKKCGKAVVRNRTKRQVRAWFLKNTSHLSPKARILRFHGESAGPLTEILKSVSRHWDDK